MTRSASRWRPRPRPRTANRTSPTPLQLRRPEVGSPTRTTPPARPPPTLVAAPSDDQVPSQTGYVYDGAGRVTGPDSYTLANETWETDTAYGGDYTTTTYQPESGEPVGGTPQTMFTNGEGQTSAIYQYHSEADAAPARPPRPPTTTPPPTPTPPPAARLHHRCGREHAGPTATTWPATRPRSRPGRGHHHQHLRRRPGC